MINIASTKAPRSFEEAATAAVAESDGMLAIFTETATEREIREAMICSICLKGPDHWIMIVEHLRRDHGLHWPIVNLGIPR